MAKDVGQPWRVRPTRGNPCIYDREGNHIGMFFTFPTCRTVSTKYEKAEYAVRCVNEPIRLEVHQQDWIPGFAGYAMADGMEPHIVLNIGDFMGCVEDRDIDPSELPYVVAESIMHEVIHKLEAWARVEFSEERVEALIERYREARRAAEKPADGRGEG